jgi:hypothetical protein
MEFIVDLSTDKPRWRSERVAGSCSFVKITRFGGRKDRHVVRSDRSQQFRQSSNRNILDRQYVVRCLSSVHIKLIVMGVQDWCAGLRKPTNTWRSSGARRSRLMSIASDWGRPFRFRRSGMCPRNSGNAAATRFLRIKFQILRPSFASAGFRATMLAESRVWAVHGFHALCDPACVFGPFPA